jgi:hypothetical protein
MRDGRVMQLLPDWIVLEFHFALLVAVPVIAGARSLINSLEFRGSLFMVGLPISG